jgi:hypothetical protein
MDVNHKLAKLNGEEKYQVKNLITGCIHIGTLYQNHGMQRDYYEAEEITIWPESNQLFNHGKRREFQVLGFWHGP